MSGNKLITLALTALLLASLAACGQHSSRLRGGNILSPQAQPQQHNNQQSQDDSANSGPLPGVFELDGRIAVNRAVSAEGTVTSQGWDALHQGQTGTNGTNTLNVEQNGTGLNLRAFAPGEFSYAVYGQEIGAEPKPLQTLIDSEVCKAGGGRDDEIPMNYYIGAADYTVGSWRWFGPFGDTGVMVMVNSDSLKSRFKSPSNNYYLCVLAANGSKASSALPAEGYVADFPIDLSNRSVSAQGDDPWGLVVKEIVTWVRDNLYTEPAVVTGLQETTDESGVSLIWDLNIDPDVFVYQVLRDDLDDADPSQLLQGVLSPTVEYVDTSGIPGKEYEYRVRARNDAGFGGPTIVKAARLLSSPSVSASDGDFQDSIRIQWPAIEGAVSYKIFRADLPTSEYSIVYTFTDLASPLEWSDFDIVTENDRRYYYYIQPVGEDIDGPIAGPDAGFATVLDPVQVLATDGDYPEKVNLVWGEEPSAKSYNIYRATDDGETDAVIIANVPSTETSWADTLATGSPWNTPRWYFVRPCTEITEGPKGQGDYGHRSIGVPVNVIASQGTAALHVAVNWDAVNNATRYKVYRSISPIDPSPNEVGEVSAPMTSFYDSSAAWNGTEGIHYYYYVAVLHSGPDSECSSFSVSAAGWRGIGIPQNITATDGLYTDRIVVSWDTVSQAASYNIYRDGVKIDAVDAPTTAYNDMDASAGASFTYYVSACIIDGEGEGGIPDTGFVANAPPVADISANTTEGDAPLSVGFDASASFDTDGNIVKYEWDWESDGTYDFDSGTTATATHEYDTAGIYNCTVRVTDDASDSDEATVSGIRSCVWHTVTLDSAGRVGTYCSITTVAGNPAVAYYYEDTSDVKYVRANDPSGSTWGDPVLVDASMSSGNHTSVKVVNGYPAIAYGISNGISYVRALDENGTSWGSSVLVVGSGFPTLHEMEVINGKPAIIWQDQLSLNLCYRRSSDANGINWGSVITLDDWAAGASLELVDGFPAVSFVHGGTQDLRFRRATDANGATWDSSIIVDNSTTINYNSSLAVVNGLPAIAYEDLLNLDIKFIRAGDVDGSAWSNSSTTVYFNQGAGFNDIRMTVIGGLPTIAYYECYGKDLRYSKAIDINGAAWALSKTVDSLGDVGLVCRLSNINGTPGICYFDETNDDLKYAYYGP